MAKSKPHGTSGVLAVPQNVSAEHARLGAIERRPEGDEIQMSSVAEVEVCPAERVPLEE